MQCVQSKPPTLNVYILCILRSLDTAYYNSLKLFDAFSMPKIEITTIKIGIYISKNWKFASVQFYKKQIIVADSY